MNLSDFNAAQLAAYLKGAADRIEENASRRLEFQPLFLAALEDARASVSEGAVHYYPLPYADAVPQDIKKEVDRGAFLLANLPGLYNANGTTMRKSLKIEAFRAKTGESNSKESLFQDFQKAARAALVADKFWLVALTHPLPLVRKAAVRRIPTTGNLLSVILPWMTGDSDVRVRREAKRAMGIFGRDRTIYRHGANAAELVVKASLGAVSELELEALVADGRSSVRYAAALRLGADSPRWAYLADDESPRLRRLAAERLPLEAPELRKLARDKVASVARTVEKRFNPKKDPVTGKRHYWWDDEEEKI